MATRLKHRQALQLATDCGLLVGNLYGRPGLIVGIARGGTALAIAFAASSKAESCSIVTLQRPTSRGFRGYLRRQLVRLVPDSIRRLYKQLFFTLTVRSRLLFGPGKKRTLDTSLKNELAEALQNRGMGTIWIIDDAIDSGGTASAIVDGVRDQLPNTPVLLFTLATSVGVRIGEQLNVFAERIDYLEGDISDLATTDVADRTCDEEMNPACGGSLLSAKTHSLYLDVDSILNRSLIHSSLTALTTAISHTGSPLRAAAMQFGATMCRAGLVSQQRMAHRIDVEVARMSDYARAKFMNCLVKQLREDSRWSLVSIAKADRVIGQLVSAAPDIALMALEEALCIPILYPATEQGPCQWLDADHSAKSQVVRENIEHQKRAGRQTEVLILGASLQSTSAAALNVPGTDTTGLQAVLAADSWWSNPAEAPDQSHG